jgi:hypothetical protein
VIDLRGQDTNVTGGAVSPSLISSFEDAVFNIYNNASGFNFRFDAVNLTANRILTAPDAAGTISLTDETVKVSAGDTTEGYLGDKFTVGDEFTKETVNPAANESLLIKFKGWIYNAARTFKGIFNVEALTADRTFTFPDISGLVAVYNNITTFIFGGQVAAGYHTQTFSATPEFDFDNGNAQQITVTADITAWTITNELPAGSYVIYFIQDGTGGWDIADGTDGTKTDNSGEFLTLADDVTIVNIIVTPAGVVYWSVVDSVTA